MVLVARVVRQRFAGVRMEPAQGLSELALLNVAAQPKVLGVLADPAAWGFASVGVIILAGKLVEVVGNTGAAGFDG